MYRFFYKKLRSNNRHLFVWGCVMILNEWRSQQPIGKCTSLLRFLDQSEDRFSSLFDLWLADTVRVLFVTHVMLTWEGGSEKAARRKSEVKWTSKWARLSIGHSRYFTRSTSWLSKFLTLMCFTLDLDRRWVCFNWLNRCIWVLSVLSVFSSFMSQSKVQKSISMNWITVFPNDLRCVF